MGARRFAVVGTLLWDARYSLMTGALAGLGRALGEVGAIIVVGGNINNVTRVMTTTIALETSKGNLSLARGLGIILGGISIRVTGLARGLRRSAVGHVGRATCWGSGTTQGLLRGVCQT